jgi:EEF1A lysine methyltransferase 2
VSWVRNHSKLCLNILYNKAHPCSWNSCYERELGNFKENPEDEGVIWFSDSGAEEKILQYLEDLADESVLHKSTSEPAIASSFLDLGTGNGHLLFALRDEDWRGKMLGLDYSDASIELARNIEGGRRGSTELNEESESHPDYVPVEFRQHDILSPSSGDGEFDVLLDKGTFDAISLSSEIDLNGRRLCESYRSSIKPFLKDGGLFIITSCNWTETELKRWFLGNIPEEDGVFALKDHLKYPTFRFQGQEGQTVVTLIFEKQAKGS